MTEFHSKLGPCPPIPDDLTLAQFILDTQHSTRAVRPLGVPWFVEDATGRKVTGEEVRVSRYCDEFELKETYKRWPRFERGCFLLRIR